MVLFRRRLGYRRRYGTRSLARGNYARFRNTQRRRRFTGRFPAKRGTVAGNKRKSYTTRSYHDFPLYLPRKLLLRQEQKYIDGIAQTMLFQNESVFYDIPYPAEGDSLYQRLGARILMNQLVIRGMLQAPPVTSVTDQPVWHLDFFIVYDRSPQTAKPGASTVFDANTLGLGFGLMQSPDNRDRFQLLYRFRYVLRGNIPVSTNSSTPYGCGGDPVTLPIDLTLNINKVATFANTNPAGAYSALTMGAVYLYCSCKVPSAVSVSFKPTLQCNTRLLFSDL